MRLLAILFFIALISCNRPNGSRNPGEIVSLKSDTTFNDIPGVHQLGEQAFDFDIIEELENVRKRHVFVNGLRKVGLLDTLKGKGPFTVFAPTDWAFPGYEENGNDGQENVRFSKRGLKAYIVPGLVRKGDLTTENVTVNNLNGQPLTLKLENGKIIINDKIRVLSPDINTSNGVIHEIEHLIEGNQ